MGHITAGVPQGSILGPILFSLYVNDLPLIFQSAMVSMYADDAEFHVAARDLVDVQNMLQDDIHQLQKWLVVNKLKANTIKTQCMLIGSPQRIGNKRLELTLFGTPLKCVDVIKYLGLMIDKHVNWSEHADYYYEESQSEGVCYHAPEAFVKQGVIVAV